MGGEKGLERAGIVMRRRKLQPVEQHGEAAIGRRTIVLEPQGLQGLGVAVDGIHEGILIRWAMSLRSHTCPEIPAG